MERADRKRRVVIGAQAKACATMILLACCPCASALNPSLDINQYAHKSWTLRDGFFKGRIFSIAQTHDGYLWLGTEFGLVRFDGVRIVPWQPPEGEHLPGGQIRSLLAARDGRLWIGSYEGLASWKDGTLTHYPELAGQFVNRLLEDREGTVWVGGVLDNAGSLCTIEKSGVRCYGKDGSLGTSVLSLNEDREGNLWVRTTTGLWRWKPGAPKFYSMPGRAYGIIEGDNGAPLVATDGGLRQLVDGKAEAYPLPGAPRQFKPGGLLRDHDGGLWIGTTDRGLLHLHNGRTDAFARADGLSSDFLESLFEDREGNIWVATLDGLDRFRDFAIPTMTEKQGLSNATVLSVLTANDGSVWLSTMNGLDRWSNGKATIYDTRSGLPDDTRGSLFEDAGARIWASTRQGIAYFDNGRFFSLNSVPGGAVYSIVSESEGSIWVSHAQGLFHLRLGQVAETIPWAKLGSKYYAQTLVADPRQGGLWLGFPEGGVAYFKDGRIRASYGSTDGLGGGRVSGLRLDLDGTLWASTEGGLSRVKDGRIATLSSKSGLPCDTVHWMIEDDDHSFWLYTACGLVRIARPELEAWVADPKRTIQTTVFDNSDGVRSNSASTGSSPAVAKTADGRIWFLPFDGVSVIDPRHIPVNKLPPPVHIEQITADRKTYDAASHRRLPALTRDLEIEYTALSLVAPEKNRFKYKLEGYDRDWQDVGNRRQAFYGNLSPRSYRFRVIASNNSGVWNQTGDTFDFSIAPAYYQTIWFRASSVAAFLVLLWGLYRYRLHQISQEFAARMGERTRIARELHDTLLQSFQASLFQMQAARNLFSRRPEKAVQTLDEAITMTEGAITEGRDAIQDLRSDPAAHSDLAQLLTATGQDLARAPDGKGSPVIFRVAVEGERQDLDPIIQDEAYRIARELLRNAFRHAQAGQIEAEIRYEDSTLRVRIRDDGKGIEPEIVKAGGRGGHWGLLGMRERAKQIGARLEFWSEAGAGTEVELNIPSSIAYGASPRIRRFQLLTKKKANP